MFQEFDFSLRFLYQVRLRSEQCYIQQHLTVITLVLKYMSLRKTFDFSLDDKFSTLPRRSILHSNQLNQIPKYQQNPSTSQPFNKHLNPFHSYMPNQTSTNCEKQSSIGKLSFHNADKLRRFEELKESNIDDLNCKIKKMISKLSEVVSPTNSSAASTYYDSKVKFKTEYSDCYEDDNKLKSQSIYTRDMIEESKVVKGIPYNLSRLDKIPQKNRAQNVDTIRRKYKDDCHKQMETKTKHEKSKSGLSSFTSNETLKQATQNADFIRFKQKLKENTQKDRQQFGIQMKYGSNKTQTLSKDQNTKSKSNLDIKMKDYQKKLNTYNSKKLLLLSSQGDIERIVLGDKTNNNNTFYKYSPYSNKESINYQPRFQLKIKPQQPISHFDETDRSQQPLTADFRQLTDKNQLQVLLKHFCNQIVHDQQFRNAKKWFSRITIDKKWDNLMSIIQNKNLDLDENAMHQIFGMKEQQQNPFYTPRDNEFSIENLVQLFVKSQEYWFDNIIKRYNHQRLFQAGFKNSRIDTIGKGYLTVEDFVRFINMEADQQMRNRDLHLIFERLRGQQQLTFEQLVQVICQ